jgi:hypothetical protein
LATIISITILTSFNRNFKFQIHLGASKARQTYSPCLNFTAQNMHAARCFLHMLLVAFCSVANAAG